MKYETPIQATYKFKKFLYEKGTSVPLKVPCEVLESSNTQYKIRLKAKCDNYPIGHILWVKKYNVEIPKPVKEYDYTDEFWNR